MELELLSSHKIKAEPVVPCSSGCQLAGKGTFNVESGLRHPGKHFRLLQVNVKRDQALEILSQEGVLLVLCSLIDNMPYVVAEAAVSPFPFSWLCK